MAAAGQSREEDHAAAVVAVPEAGREFCCKYCDRKFNNKQALGGHQNAHRMERDRDLTAKRNRRGGFMDYYPFSPFFGVNLLLAGARGQGNYWNQAPSMPTYFLPGHPIPPPEIPAARPLPPYAYPFPSVVSETGRPLPSRPPVENHPPRAHQVLLPEMTIPGHNTFPVGSVPANSHITPMLGSIAINYSNPMNAPEMIEDVDQNWI